MQILVDADACPVRAQIEDVARKYMVPVTMLCDTHHVLRSDYCRVRRVDAGKDAVDIALTNLCRPGDIVVTQDFGLASLVLNKGAYVIHHSGRAYRAGILLLWKPQLDGQAAADTHGGIRRRRARNAAEFEEKFEDMLILALSMEDERPDI